MPARRFVMPCIESSYGVAKASFVLGTDAGFVRLSESNAFEAEMAPQVDMIAYGGGRVTVADEVTDMALVQGSISCILNPGILSTLLLNWAFTPINSGRTVPWTTTDGSNLMPAGDLASLAFYHAFQNPDASYVREKWLGCKSTKGSLKFTEDPNGRKLIFQSDFVGIRSATNSFEASPPAAPDATEFPAPTEANYPTGAWLFSHFATGTGTCQIGSARTQISDWSLMWENTLTAGVYEAQVIQFAKFLGRKVTVDVGLRYKPSPDDLAAWQARTTQTSKFKLDNGTKTLLLDIQTKNRINVRKRVFADGKEYGATVTLQNYWDASTGNDLALTLT